MNQTEDIVQLLEDCDLCVLSTSRSDEPYASLMAYVVEPDMSALYMVTRRDTRKWANLVRNPKLAVLIDDRESALSGDRASTRAVTVGGLHDPVADSRERTHILRLMAARHPQLREILEAPDAEIIRLRPRWFLLAAGDERSFFVTAENS